MNIYAGFIFKKASLSFFSWVEHDENASKLYHEKYICLKLNEIKPQKQSNCIFMLSLHCTKKLGCWKNPKSLKTLACLICTGISVGESSIFRVSSVFLVNAFFIRKFILSCPKTGRFWFLKSTEPFTVIGTRYHAARMHDY